MALAISSAGYPLLAVFWTIFEIFAFVVWMWLIVMITIDVFRSDDLSGWGKAAWLVFVLFLPVIGILSYLIVRGQTMQERAARSARQQEQEMRRYIRDAAGSPPATADQLSKLASLRAQGVISEAEFEQQKETVLAADSATRTGTSPAGGGT